MSLHMGSTEDREEWASSPSYLYRSQSRQSLVSDTQVNKTALFETKKKIPQFFRRTYRVFFLSNFYQQSLPITPPREPSPVPGRNFAQTRYLDDEMSTSEKAYSSCYGSSSGRDEYQSGKVQDHWERRTSYGDPVPYSNYAMRVRL